jgi:hypothetical protein
MSVIGTAHDWTRDRPAGSRTVRLHEQEPAATDHTLPIETQAYELHRRLGQSIAALERREPMTSSDLATLREVLALLEQLAGDSPQGQAEESRRLLGRMLRGEASPREAQRQRTLALLESGRRLLGPDTPRTAREFARAILED